MLLSSDSAETELGPASRGMLQRKGFNGDWLELTLDTGETRRLYGHLMLATESIRRVEEFKAAAQRMSPLTAP